jgi:hypothetical protein
MVTQLGMTPDRAEDLMNRINNAQSAEELHSIIYFNSNLIHSNFTTHLGGDNKWLMHLYNWHPWRNLWCAGLVQAAYDRLLEFALRSEPLIRSVADKTPARQSIPGSTVTLQRYVDLAANTTALTETTDPDAVALSTPTNVNYYS